jgi:ABC-2 type transport system ATP-binding protein
MNMIETHELTKRYGRARALRECTVAIPAGHVVALVGPNGAGKTTLLHLAVDLTRPTTGEIRVLGGFAPGSRHALDRIGFVAQDTPLYPYLTVGDTLRLVANLSTRFDREHARARLADLGIPLHRRVGTLSGGQHAQVALAVTLARHPELLILDEPVARLDPLARYEFMAVLMAAVAEDGISVVLSSHVVAELQRVCDHLIVLAAGTVQVAGSVEELLATHQVITGPAAQADAVAARLPVVTQLHAGRQTSLLIRTTNAAGGPAGAVPADWRVEPTNLEELVLAYLRSPQAAALPGPARHPISAAVSA